MSFRKIVLALVASTALTTHAWAQETPSGDTPVKRIKHLPGDENRDGLVSKDEYLNAAAKRFDALDANDDGNITSGEQSAHDEARRIAREKKQAAQKKTGQEKTEDKGFLNRFFN